MTCASILAFTSYTWLIHHEPATRVASYAYVNPLIALIVGVTLGGENVSSLQMAGAAMIILGVVATLLSKNQKRATGACAECCQPLDPFAWTIFVIGAAAAAALYSVHRRPGAGVAWCFSRRPAVEERWVFRSQTALTSDVPAAVTLSWRAAARFLRSPLQPILDALSSTLYPASCALCKQSLLRFSSLPICESCWSAVAPQSGVLCTHCGEDLGLAAVLACASGPRTSRGSARLARKSARRLRKPSPTADMRTSCAG